MDNDLESELEWSPVWTNIFYVVYTFFAIILLLWYRKKWYSKHAEFSIFRSKHSIRLSYFIISFIFSSVVLCVVSTLHHLNSSAFHNHKIKTTASKAFNISDQVFAWLTLILMFSILFITKKSNDPIYNMCLMFYMLTFIMAVILYFLALHYNKQGKYDSYDIYHSDWHILTSFLGVIIIIVIFNHVR